MRAIALTVVCCSCATEPAGWDVPPEKYADPSAVPVELNLPPEAIELDAVDVTVQQGEMQRFYFEKEAGYHYIIGLDSLSGDLDLYSHWVVDLGPSSYQYVSWNWNREDEQIDVTATQDGTYYIGVHGYEAASGRLRLFGYVPTDEVQWPVGWGRDGASEAELVAGGLGWLDLYNYGGGCGYTFHPGLDFNHEGDFQDPVYAVADGVVVEAADLYGGWGKVILVSHTLSTGLRFNSQYAHLDSMVVRTGDTVVRGQQIGRIGSAGTGPHLHFEIRSDTYLSSGSFPCSQGNHSVEADYLDPRTFIELH